MTAERSVRSLGFATEHLFDLDFVADASIPEIVDALIAAAADDPVDEWRCVVTPNVDHIVRYERVPHEADAARHASVVLPDGMPIIWASRFLRKRLRGRLTGSDLLPPLWQRLVDLAIPTVVVASSQAVSGALVASHPRVRVLVPPMFAVTDEHSVTSIIDWVDGAVAEIGARFVIVGVSMPKHHVIANRLRDRWRGRYAGAPIVLLLGASPDLMLGLTPRAPDWMQRAGVEWLYRLYLEPRRLAKRYLVDDVAFVKLVFREWWRARSTGASTRGRYGPSSR